MGARESDWPLIVARDEEDRFAGYIWLTEDTDYFPGQKQAFILDICVEEKQRRGALGQRFLELAERWGMGKGGTGSSPYRRLITSRPQGYTRREAAKRNG